MLTVAISQLLGSIILFLLLIASFVDNCCNNFNLHIKQSSLNRISNLCNTKIQIAKFLQDSNKTQCLLELNEAMEIAAKLNKSGKIKEIERIKNSFKQNFKINIM